MLLFQVGVEVRRKQNAEAGAQEAQSPEAVVETTRTRLGELIREYQNAGVGRNRIVGEIMDLAKKLQEERIQLYAGRYNANGEEVYKKINAIAESITPRIATNRSNFIEEMGVKESAWRIAEEIYRQATNGQANEFLGVDAGQAIDAKVKEIRKVFGLEKMNDDMFDLAVFSMWNWRIASRALENDKALELFVKKPGLFGYMDEIGINSLVCSGELFAAVAERASGQGRFVPVPAFHGNEMAENDFFMLFERNMALFNRMAFEVGNRIEYDRELDRNIVGAFATVCSFGNQRDLNEMWDSFLQTAKQMGSVYPVYAMLGKREWAQMLLEDPAKYIEAVRSIMEAGNESRFGVSLYTPGYGQKTMSFMGVLFSCPPTQEFMDDPKKTAKRYAKALAKISKAAGKNEDIAEVYGRLFCLDENRGTDASRTRVDVDRVREFLADPEGFAERAVKKMKEGG